MSKIMVGATLPDYELPDENGELRRLSELQGDDMMALMLGRGEHCPRERQQHRVHAARHDSAERPARRLQAEDLTGAHWTYLADSELEVQTELDIKEYTDPIHDATVRLKPDVDPTTAAAKKAWKLATANGNVPAHH